MPKPGAAGSKLPRSPGHPRAADGTHTRKEPSKKEKAKKRNSTIKPQRDKNGVPLWDEDDESMQQVAEALEAIMAARPPPPFPCLAHFAKITSTAAIHSKS